MSLTQTESDLLAIMRAAVQGTSASPAGADYPSVFALADQQRLLPIVFETVRETDAAQANATLFAAVKRQVIGQVLTQVVRAAEFSALYRKLRAAGLHPIVVKGQLCSRLYPLPDHRISADDDLFIPDAEFSMCHAVLLENGLHTACPPQQLKDADEISYKKEGSPLYIELHRRLFDFSEDAHNEINRFFAHLPAGCEENSGYLTMQPHEHLLYLLLHAYKHFVLSGVGLRQFYDIGLWAHAYYDRIDWTLLHSQCDSVHAATFAAAVFEIDRTALGMNISLPTPWEKPHVSIEPLLHDVFAGGIYGHSDEARLHSSTVTLNAVNSSRTGKRRCVLRSVFPGRAYMEKKYAYLKKHPVLLPVAWAQRIFHYASEMCAHQNNSAADSLRLGKERIELLKLYDIIP